MNIAFRVDADEEIGLGHLMRSLVLASEFPESMNIYFIIKNNLKAKKLIANNDHNVLELNSKTNESDLKKTISLISQHHIKIVITDSYKFDFNYLKTIKKNGVFLVSIHDFAPFKFPSDILINSNIYAADLDYKAEQNAKMLLGTKFLLLREEFQDLSAKSVKKEVNNILITVGGADPQNLTPFILTNLQQFFNKYNYNFKIDIVIGPVFNNIIDIIKKVRRLNLEVSLNFNLNKMSKLMHKADIAITAGGGTLYELAACGLPALTILQADNQKLGVAKLDKKTIINLGYKEEIEENKFIDTLYNLINNLTLRRELSTNGQKLVDGQGARRVAKEILDGYRKD